jgi:DNA-binding beta-propeller fold protein YncE
MLVNLVLIMAGCATTTVPQKPTGEFFWPSPPDPPRIKWVTQWTGRYDFEKPSAWLTFLIGEERAEALTRPSGVVADSAGNIYVADTDLHVVFVFDLEKNTVRPVGEGDLSAPVAIAIDDKRGLLYVTDPKKHSVVVLDKKSGKSVFGIPAQDDFKNPAGIAFDDQKERLYVSDSKSHVVKVFDRTGNPLFVIGKRGSDEGQFNFPGYLAFHDGKLYVSDTLNYRVQIFDAEGKFLKSIGRLGDRPGSFARPKGVAVDSEGHIYVVDAAFYNIQIFNAAGDLLLIVGEPGGDPKGLNLPSGIFIDRNDRIYVSDTLNKRVQVYQYLKEQGGK